MARIATISGIILMVISFVLLFMVLEENSPLTLQLVTALNCGQGEKATQELGSYVAGRSGRPVSFYCVNAQGVERDVSVPGFFSMTSAFLVPFLGSMVLMSIGFRALGRSAVGAVANNMLAGTPVNAQGFTVTTSTPNGYVVTNPQDLTPEQQAKMQQAMNLLDKMMPGMNVQMPDANPSGSTNLTAKLQELENARQQGLITQEEFNRLRQQILDGIA